MSCRYCPDCDIRFPLTFTRCQVCEEQLGYNHDLDVQGDWKEAVESRAAWMPSREEKKVLDWRRDQMRAKGLDGLLLENAVHSGIDVHRFIELVEAGCPPETAARILL